MLCAAEGTHAGACLACLRQCVRACVRAWERACVRPRVLPRRPALRPALQPESSRAPHPRVRQHFCEAQVPEARKWV